MRVHELKGYLAHMDEIALIIKRIGIVHRESITNAARLFEAFLLREDRPFMQRYCPQGGGGR